MDLNKLIKREVSCVHMCACPCGAILAEVLNSSYVVLNLLYVIMSVTIKYFRSSSVCLRSRIGTKGEQLMEKESDFKCCVCN
jgi:hypothetical protein